MGPMELLVFCIVLFHLFQGAGSFETLTTSDGKHVFVLHTKVARNRLEQKCKDSLGEGYTVYFPSTNLEVQEVIEALHEIGRTADFWIRVKNQRGEDNRFDGYSWQSESVTPALWFQYKARGVIYTPEPSTDTSVIALRTKRRYTKSITGKHMLGTKYFRSARSKFLCTDRSDYGHEGGTEAGNQSTSFPETYPPPSPPILELENATARPGPTGKKGRESVPVLTCPCKCPQSRATARTINQNNDNNNNNNATMTTISRRAEERELIKEIERDLTLTSSVDLSTSVRKKSSAKDDRPSSQIGGFVAISLMCIVFGALVVFDLASCFQFGCRHHVKRSKVKPAPPVNSRTSDADDRPNDN